MYDLGYHVVWCPKYRRPVLTGPVRVRLEELLRTKCALSRYRDNAYYPDLGIMSTSCRELWSPCGLPAVRSG